MHKCFSCPARRPHVRESACHLSAGVCDISPDKLRRPFISMAPGLHYFVFFSLGIRIIHDVITPQHLFPSTISNKHMRCHNSCGIWHGQWIVSMSVIRKAALFWSECWFQLKGTTELMEQSTGLWKKRDCGCRKLLMCQTSSLLRSNVIKFNIHIFFAKYLNIGYMCIYIYVCSFLVYCICVLYVFWNKYVSICIL
jgi:hypothetical protein